MDYQFPRQLFPTFYNNGPPTAVLKECCGKWGSYDRVLPLVAPLLTPPLSLRDVLGLVEEGTRLFKTYEKKRKISHMSFLQLNLLPSYRIESNNIHIPCEWAKNK